MFIIITVGKSIMKVATFIEDLLYVKDCTLSFLMLRRTL